MNSIFSMRAIRNTVVAAAMVLAPAASFAGVFISVGFAPPALPVYVQPVCPGDGYLWNPGYWAYGAGGLLLGSGRLGAAAAGWRVVDASATGALGRACMPSMKATGVRTSGSMAA